MAELEQELSVSELYEWSEVFQMEHEEIEKHRKAGARKPRR